MWEWGNILKDYKSCEKRTAFIKEDLEYLLKHLIQVKDDEKTTDYIYHQLFNIHDRVQDLCELVYRTKEAK